jgi:threonine/homoserine/homoserine lactone efflux protein
MNDPLLFVLAAMLLLGTPGPTNTLLWVSAATSGTRRSLPLLLGELAGYLCAITAIVLVLQPLLDTAPQLRNILAALVAVYVAVLAGRLWQRADTPEAPQAAITVSKVFVTTLLNPKAFVFALGIMPVGDPAILGYFGLLSVCIVTAGSGWVILGGLAGAAVGPRNMVWLTRASSFVLAGFASLILWNTLQSVLQGAAS